MTNLGKMIKHLRIEKGYSLIKLAQKAKMSKSYIWQLENGEQMNPSLDVIFNLSMALDVPKNYFFNEKVPSPKNISNESFLLKFNKLSEKDKKRVHQIIDEWTK